MVYPAMNPITKPLSNMENIAKAPNIMDPKKTPIAVDSLWSIMSNALIDDKSSMPIASLSIGIRVGAISSAKMHPIMKPMVKRTINIRKIFLFSTNASLISFLIFINLILWIDCI